MDGQGAIFLVDGPNLPALSPLGRAAARAWGRKHEMKLRGGAHLVNDTAKTCARGADCPRSRHKHRCVPHGCGAGARGAPEARGKCRADVCLVRSGVALTDERSS
jgi:hypothetical protein